MLQSKARTISGNDQWLTGNGKNLPTNRSPKPTSN